MKSFYNYIITIIFCFNVLLANAATDYFGIDKISFNDKDFLLSWSANSPNNTFIEDFLPAKSSITRFNEKFSVYYQDSVDFSKIIEQKKKELQTMKVEQQIDTFFVDESNPNDVLIDYISELNQGGTVFVAQHTVYRYINYNDYVVNYEFQQRAYTKTKQFVDKMKSKRLKFVNELKKFQLPKLIQLTR